MPNTHIYLKQLYKKLLLIAFIKKTIVIRFLKVQNKWIVLKSSHYF